MSATWWMAALLMGPPAESGQLQITWRAPPECPDESAVREQALARLEGPSLPVEVEATIDRTSGDAGSGEETKPGWTLTMSIVGPRGVDERTMRADACEELVEAAGLLIAVAADPHGDEPPEVPEQPIEPATTEPESPIPIVDEPAEPPPEPDPAPTPPESTPTEQPIEPNPRPDPPSRHVRALVRVEGMAQLLRLLPQPVGGGLGGAVGLWPGRPWLRLEARAHYVFAQQATYTDPAQGGDFDLWSVGTSACVEPRASVLTVPLCGGVELGAMRGQGFGVSEPGSATSLWAGLPLDVALSWSPRPWLALWFGPRLLVSLRRPRFHIRDLDALFRAGPAALRVVAGIEFRFP